MEEFIKKFKNKLPSYLFSIAETLVIFLVGILLGINYKEIIFIILTFAITKLSMVKLKIAKSMHYKHIHECVIWSLLVLLSLFASSEASLLIAIAMSMLTAITVSTKADTNNTNNLPDTNNLNNKISINDLYMWSGKSSKYDALKDLISLSPNNSMIIEHEEYWRKNYPMRYKIFKLYFRENNSYDDIRKLENLPDNTIIKKECATIYSVLERPLSLPPIKDKNL